MSNNFRIYRVFIRGKSGEQIKKLLDTQAIPVRLVNQPRTLFAPLWEIEGEIGNNFFDLYLPSAYTLQHDELGSTHNLQPKALLEQESRGLVVVRFDSQTSGDLRAEEATVNQARNLFNS